MPPGLRERKIKMRRSRPKLNRLQTQKLTHFFANASRQQFQFTLNQDNLSAIKLVLMPIWFGAEKRLTVNMPNANLNRSVTKNLTACF